MNANEKKARREQPAGVPSQGGATEEASVMVSHLEYQIDDRLPRLAWCASARRDGRIEVRHGTAVETWDGGFFEGAWDGCFDEGAFPEAVVCAGSGATLRNEGLVCAAPTHTLECLYAVPDASGVSISNSLPFLLVTTNEWIRKDYYLYQQDLISIIDGLKHGVEEIEITNGRCVSLYYHCNVVIDRHLKLLRKAKRVPDAFDDFADYAGFLHSAVVRTAENARDPRRRVIYTPLATVSRGYDSPACAVLARAVGCREVITFRRSRGEYPDTDDAGTRIGETLGLRVLEFDRDSGQNPEGFPEAEFVACGRGGEDVVMAALEPVLRNRLFFTGFHGDKVWAKDNKKVGSDIVRGDASGGNLAEFRLRVGFIHLPVPFIGCVQHEAIARIANSPEMASWSVEWTGPYRSGYNRPIARRIVEEAGVPRDWFGQSKKAITQPMALVPRERWISNPPLNEVLKPETYSAFSRFCETEVVPMRPVLRLRYLLLHGLYLLNERIACRLSRLLGVADPQDLIRVHWRYQEPIDRSMLLFHWGMQVVRGRYAFPTEGPTKTADGH